MARTIHLTGLKQGIQRVREKGGASPDTLYDLNDGYVGIDGAIEQRPGTVLDYALPAGTLGMCAHDGDLVVFSTSPKACPAGTRCEVLTHPFFPSQGLTYIWYAAPFLGYLYVVAEFQNGDVYHYWLQAANEWEASTTYQEGQIIVPSTPNGLGYKAHRVLPKYPQWVPGMEVVLGTKVEPTTANGYYYEATATSEAAGVGTPGGSPNPNPPGDPPTDGGPPSVPRYSTGGGLASTTPGPYGGFPDDASFPIAAPSVFGSDVVGADFTDPASLAAWRDRLGAALASDWEVISGKAQFTGISGTAYGYAWRMSISPQPFPRYSITVTAKVQTTGGQTARVGVAWGTNTSIEPGSDVPNNIEADPAASYLTETTVSYTWELQRQTEFITAFLYYGHVNFMPVVQFTELDGAPEIGTVDDATMVIAEVPVPTTPITLDHLDFDTGLTDWDIWPDPSNPYAATVAAAGGELSMTPTHELAKFANAYCVAPIDAAVADAVGKYIVIQAEVWCDDPTSDSNGYATGGAHMYLAPNTVTDGYAKNSVYVAQRGDWTLRKWWYRINAVPSGSLLSYQVCAQMKCALGYSVKVRNITAAITDSVMD